MSNNYRSVCYDGYVVRMTFVPSGENTIFLYSYFLDYRVMGFIHLVYDYIKARHLYSIQWWHGDHYTQSYIHCGRLRDLVSCAIKNYDSVLLEEIVL